MRQVFAGNAAQACRLNQVKGGPVGIDDACASATGLQTIAAGFGAIRNGSSRKYVGSRPSSWCNFLDGLRS